MPCILKRRQTDGVFVGPRGRKVRIDLQSERPARTVRLAYAGEQDGEAPFEFTIKGGQQKLVIVALGVDTNQRMVVTEVSGGTSCPLRNFFWSRTNFSTELDIEGV